MYFCKSGKARLANRDVPLLVFMVLMLPTGRDNKCNAQRKVSKYLFKQTFLTAVFKRFFFFKQSFCQTIQ